MKDAFIKLHISIILAGATGIFGKLISLNEALLVWYRMMLASLLFLLVLSVGKRLNFFRGCLENRGSRVIAGIALGFLLWKYKGFECVYWSGLFFSGRFLYGFSRTID